MSLHRQRHVQCPSGPPSSRTFKNMFPFPQDSIASEESREDLPTSPISTRTVDDDWHSAIETLHEEEVSHELQRDDIIIALMGMTGSGKSTFINTISGKEDLAKVGHSLLSCTQEIETYLYCDPTSGKRIIFVDTPGFDDTNVADFIILEMVTQWLVKTYSADCKLSGLLFFHRISDNRMGHTAIHHIDVFQNLCGNPSLANVVLVTNMWDELKEDVAETREKQLKADYWHHLLQNGARTARHDRSRDSCHKIVDLIGHSPRKTTLLIQHEMCVKHLPFHSTSVAATLGKRLTELVASLTKLIRSLENPANETRKTQEEQKKALFEKQLNKLCRNIPCTKARAWGFPFSGFKRPTLHRRSSEIRTDDYEIVSKSTVSPASPITPASASSKLSSARFDLYYGVYTSLDKSIKVLSKISNSIGVADSNVEAELVKAISVSLNVARALKKIINVDRDIISLLGRVAFFMRAVWDYQDSIDENMRVLLRHLLDNLERLENVATQASRRITLLRLSVPLEIRPIITKCHEYITLGCNTMQIENIAAQDTNIARLERLLERIDQASDRLEANIQVMGQAQKAACPRQISI